MQRLVTFSASSTDVHLGFFPNMDYGHWTLDNGMKN